MLVAKGSDTMPQTLQDLLRERRDDLVARFVQEIERKDLPPSKLTKSMLANHIPRFLDELAFELDAERGDNPRASYDAVDMTLAARKHGSQRWAIGYELEPLVREYGVLRHVILQFAKHAGLDLSIDDFDALARWLNVAVTEAVTEYVRYRDEQADAQRANLEFLARAGQLLSSTLDFQSALTRLTALIVPTMADWCVVHVEGMAAAELPIAHVDPDKVAVIRSLYERYPLPADAPHGHPAVARNGVSQLVDTVPEGTFEHEAQDAEHLELLRAIGTRSSMTVPLRVQNTMFGAITFASSITHKQYNQNDLLLAEELARRAGVAIDNARLYELSQRERARVEAATRAKDDFVAMVSHELRTPLNAIVGWTRLLRSGTLPEDKRDHALEVIERNGRAQTQLVSDLLDISRVSTGRIRIQPAQVDLANIVEIAVEDARVALEARRVNVVADLDRSGSILRADGDRLQQVVWNLLTNSIKFTPKGGTIQISLRRVESDLVLTVHDDGVGIPMEVIPHVFEAFWQSDTSLARSHGGLGIGLSIAQHLVQLHGGSITAHSDGRGKGATFTVRLPVSPLASATIGVFQVQPAKAEVDWPVGLEGLKVLVVDDDDEARELLRVVLDSCGIESVDVSRVSDALAVVASFQPNVVISDIGMPEGDGFSLVKAIRSLPGDAATVPVIALTAFAGREDRTRALVSGFNAHLTKPVAPGELLVAIGDATGRLVRR